ncbi:MAG TPA: flagellar biosynthetic protein FliO [Ignavibacteriales bacterium]|mgnify:CR=1 FL=1|nr:flagellar biosynthetic protein FliO [Ignavibacteriales bacterium]HOL80333.1 flagellar biosynthetic protein FliO [Ignavibacteriales bacterium]HOM64612.1 flagellar biosynthetic protein FliO [Ignavibacteriales bacterium]HPD68200.1 flagellar biosynthetic protein FliO [Ignavibacteriales bacterium]HPP32522.1 flagellar biosynthetic protein FliO [Ignavibacteriales bacterium]
MLNFLSGFFAFLFLIGILGATLYLIKKFNIKINNKLNPEFKVRILYTFPIMQKKFLAIVQVDEKVFLLGVTDYNINLISELDPNILTYVQENTNNFTPKINFSEIYKLFQKNK